MTALIIKLHIKLCFIKIYYNTLYDIDMLHFGVSIVVSIRFGFVLKNKKIMRKYNALVVYEWL